MPEFDGDAIRIFDADVGGIAELFDGRVRHVELLEVRDPGLELLPAGHLQSEMIQPRPEGIERITGTIAMLAERNQELAPRVPEQDARNTRLVGCKRELLDELEPEDLAIPGSTPVLVSDGQGNMNRSKELRHGILPSCRWLIPIDRWR